MASNLTDISKYLNEKEVKEFDHWYKFINELLDFKYEICIKGGSILGLQILNDIFEKSSDIPTEFITHKLIKDWDFVLFAPDADYELIRKLAWKNNIIREG